MKNHFLVGMGFIGTNLKLNVKLFDLRDLAAFLNLYLFASLA